MSPTPGPWRLRSVSDECGDYWIIEMADARRSSWEPQHRIEYPDGGTVEELHPEQFAEAKANAHLIAAAPDLLAALKEVERSCPCGARPESPHTHPHVMGCLIGAAIAKAEGR